MKQIDVAQPFPLSLWAATAEPVHACTPLERDVQTDVLIVGAGFTGLSTALHLAEQGLQVCVIDANDIGWGASGRNGGQVIPGLKYDPDEMLARYGPQEGAELTQIVGGAADTVFDLIQRHNIRCDAVRSGWVQSTRSPKVLETIQGRARQWQKHGAPAELLDRHQVAERLGTDIFLGGWIDKRAGSVNPLGYARGLAKVAIAKGVTIHAHTRADALQRNGDTWHLRTSAGPSIRARQVLLATNGYSDGLWPNLAQSIMAVNSFLVATRPLPEAVGASILPHRDVSSDSKRLLLYIRKDRDGRLVMGGRGPFREPQGTDDWAHLERALKLMFPQLKHVEFDYRWAGRLAVTRDFLPHIHRPEPGLTIALGYNGRGVAMATTLGKHLAAFIGGAAKGLPLPVGPIEPIPFHGLQRFYIAAGVAWYGLLDSLS